MKSVRTKLFLLIFIVVFGVYLVLSLIGAHDMLEMIETDTAFEMSLLADQKAEELNVRLSGIERAVDQLAYYIRDNIDTERMKTEKDYMSDFLDDFTKRSIGAAKVAGNVENIYFRLEPNEYGSKSGVFLIKNAFDDYLSVDCTDILLYEPDDREHVAWYYEPLKSGKAIWLEPYYNRNINIYMTSYVAPIEAGGHFIGVVGMDIYMTFIHSVMDDIDYKDGFGFLVAQNGSIVYHQDYPYGLSSVMVDDDLAKAIDAVTGRDSNNQEFIKYMWNGKPHILTSASLGNGMYLAISVPEDEIMSPRVKLWHKMLILFIGAFAVIFLIVWLVMAKIINPVRDLTVAAKRLSKGELSVPINYHSDDEIGALAESIRMMAGELQEYIGYIHAQAYADEMTGVGNKASYADMIKILDRKAEEGFAEYFVGVFDVNGLKSINDRLGHEYGDMVISDAANALKTVFGGERVYRVGGDEFVIIVEGEPAEEIDTYTKALKDTLERHNKTGKLYDVDLTISQGYAVYVEGGDTEYKQVFRRADEAMYKDKEQFYRGKRDRRKHTE